MTVPNHMLTNCHDNDKWHHHTIIIIIIIIVIVIVIAIIIIIIIITMIIWYYLYLFYFLFKYAFILFIILFTLIMYLFFIIPGNSRKWPSFCAKRCQIDQHSKFDSIWVEIHPKPMSCGWRRLQGFCMTRGFIFSFWRLKMSRITRETPAKKVSKPRKKKKKHQTSANPEKSYKHFFSGTHLITSLTANSMTNARSLRNALQLLEFLTLLESKKC